MTDRTIKSWFEQAMPAPTIHNFQVQLGCHFEEVAEMLIELRVVGTAQHVSGHAVQEALRAVSKLADQLKQGEITVVPLSRKLLLDSICDQNVTGTGVAHMLGMDIEGALNEVNQSNWSKFVDGKPIFDDNGKIKKGPGYKEPDLMPFVNLMPLVTGTKLKTNNPKRRNTMKPTDVTEFLHNLNAGVFAQQVAVALSSVAAGVVEHGKKGKVTLSFDISQIGESHRVKITHKLDFAQPTKRGQKREDTALDTPMYVTANGLELFMSDPTAQLFSRDQAPVVARSV